MMNIKIPIISGGMLLFPKVSIIVPVYNLENRIEKTLNSISSQDFYDYEIVVVDDCSSDGSAEVIKRFFMKNPTLRHKLLKHDQNKGVSAARNNGIKEASGEYIVFWDGDDLAKQNFVSDLYLQATENGNLYDIIMAGHTEINENNGRERSYPVPIQLTKGKTPQQIACLRITGKIKPHMCSSIFRRAFLENCGLSFHEGCTAGEDVEFIIKALVRSKLTGFSKKYNYIYIIHDKMGSKNNTNTPYKKIKRYTENTMAHLRTTKYISQFVQDSDLKFINDYLLLPQTVQRQINLLAINNNFTAFNNKIKDAKTKKILWSSIKSIKIKAEVFIKSLLLLFTPKLYYMYYLKRYNWNIRRF
jgi:glycosyltransferase involved in cell wall biosynthesis